MGGEAGVLLVTDVAVLPATAVLWALQSFAEYTDSGKRLSILTQADLLGGRLHADSSSLDVVISLAETPGHHSLAWLTEIARALRPGGTLVLQEPLSRRDIVPEEAERLGDSAAVIQSESVLQRNLLLASFVGSSSVNCIEGVGLAASFSHATSISVGSHQGPLLLPTAFKVQKPTWEAGSSFSLRKKSSIRKEEAVKANGAIWKLAVGDVNVNLAQPTNGVGSWKVPAVDLENDELVDEDSLLTEEDLRRPELPSADDCEVGKAGRKACKNCTCGRAELEEKQPETKLSLGQLNNPQSACGSCGLGDAFRCNGCPYRGLPAFKLGDKITLTGSLLTADV